MGGWWACCFTSIGDLHPSRIPPPVDTMVNATVPDAMVLHFAHGDKHLLQRDGLMRDYAV